MNPITMFRVFEHTNAENMQESLSAFAAESPSRKIVGVHVAPVVVRKAMGLQDMASTVMVIIQYEV